MPNRLSFTMVGDAFITRRIPEDYDGFAEVRALIKESDVRFCNLEMTFHNCEGYPAAHSGGTWAMTDPVMLDDLASYGFNIYTTANNHSFDYSEGGVLATIRHIKERGMLFSGTGADLAAACAPVYFEHKRARVALISASASYHSSGAAGMPTAELPGRPGLNPLAHDTRYEVTPEYFEVLQKIAAETQMNAGREKNIRNGYDAPDPEGVLVFGGLMFERSDRNRMRTAPKKADLQRITAAIADARRQADYVLVSLHAHDGLGADENVCAEYVETFCHACIDAGADAILGHGPHRMRGIEIYKEKPIFYSVGNFLFETETVSTQPADAYARQGMPLTTTVAEYMNRRSKGGTRGYGVQEDIWRAFIPSWEMEGGKLTALKLTPITLDIQLPYWRKGLPRLSQSDAALEHLAALSRPYGTEIEIRDHVGYVKL